MAEYPPLPRKSPTVYQTRAVMESAPGPYEARYGIPIDYPGLYRFAPGNASTRDGVRVLDASGGQPGKWLLVAPPGVTTVDTSADLPATVIDGMQYYVESQRAVYTGMNAAWVRTATDSSWAAQATWHVATTGSADATGATSGAKTTIAEVLARIGSHPPPTGVTIYVYDSLNLSEFVYYGKNEPDNDHWIYLEGVPMVAATGTIATITNWDASGGTIGVITGSASLVAHVGKLLRVTSGARAGARFWIASNPSGTTVRITSARDDAYSPTATDLQVGDPYEVLTLPTLSGSLTVQHGSDVQFALLTIGTDNAAHSIIINGAATFDACKVFGCDVYSGGKAVLYACSIGDNLRAQGDGSITAYGCLAEQTTIRLGGTATLVDHLVQGGRMVIEGGAVAQSSTDSFVAGCDYGAAVLAIEPGGLFISNGYLAGSGVTGGTTGRVRVYPGARLLYANVPTVAGTGAESTIGGYERTFAQWPYSHASNRAEATLTADDPTP